MDYSQRFKVVPAVYLLLIKDGKVLLLRRFNTGYEDGNYSLPAGHADGGESFTAAMVREAKEEIDVEVRAEDMALAHIMHRNAADGERVDLFFRADKWEGEPRIMEPHKCDELKWCGISELPANVIPYVRQALEYGLSSRVYGEWDWART